MKLKFGFASGSLVLFLHLGKVNISKARSCWSILGKMEKISQTLTIMAMSWKKWTASSILDNCSIAS
jgi:hypothetical protein